MLIERRKCAAACAAMTIMLCASASAEDHLNPEDSVYTGRAFSEPGRDRAFLASFGDAFAGDVIVRAIVQPSFHTEFAVGVKRSAEVYKIFYQEFSEQLWRYAILDTMKGEELTSPQIGKTTRVEEIAKLEKSLPASPNGVKVNRCERFVDPALGAKIISVWEGMLLQSRYPENEYLGADGVIFHFSGIFGAQQMAAQTWSPPAKTKTGMLANIAFEMKTFCTDRAQPTRLTGMVNALSARLTSDRNK